MLGGAPGWSNYVSFVSWEMTVHSLGNAVLRFGNNELVVALLGLGTVFKCFMFCVPQICLTMDAYKVIPLGANPMIIWPIKDHFSLPSLLLLQLQMCIVMTTSQWKSIEIWWCDLLNEQRFSIGSIQFGNLLLIYIRNTRKKTTNGWFLRNFKWTRVLTKRDDRCNFLKIHKLISNFQISTFLVIVWLISQVELECDCSFSYIQTCNKKLC